MILATCYTLLPVSESYGLTRYERMSFLLRKKEIPPDSDIWQGCSSFFVLACFLGGLARYHNTNLLKFHAASRATNDV